jgi:hypothetical protein
VSPRPETLRLYGEASDKPALEWALVDERLRDAGTYWVDARTPAPHPRPVWGVWADGRLHLSIGSPAIARVATEGADVTVHLESGTEVVIVEGAVSGVTAATDVIAAYDAKYDWSYDLDVYGSLTVVEPRTVLAWTAAGFAGRDGFVATSRWTFPG